MKLCTAKFPTLFFKQKEKEIKDFFRPRYIDDQEISVKVFFEIENETNLLKKVIDFFINYKGVPMTFGQEQDVDGCDFSDRQDIYILPSGETIIVNSDKSYNVIPIVALKKIKESGELKRIIEDTERKDPSSKMDSYYITYNQGKYDERFYNALFDLAEALDKVSQLCSDEVVGDDFNEHILANTLGGVWGKSIDEMAWDVEKVAKDLKERHEKYKEMLTK